MPGSDGVKGSRPDVLPFYPQGDFVENYEVFFPSFLIEGNTNLQKMNLGTITQIADALVRYTEVLETSSNTHLLTLRSCLSLSLCSTKQTLPLFTFSISFCFFLFLFNNKNN